MKIYQDLDPLKKIVLSLIKNNVSSLLLHIVNILIFQNLNTSLDKRVL